MCLPVFLTSARTQAAGCLSACRENRGEGRGKLAMSENDCRFKTGRRLGISRIPQPAVRRIFVLTV